MEGILVCRDYLSLDRSSIADLLPRWLVEETLEATVKVISPAQFMSLDQIMSWCKWCKLLLWYCRIFSLRQLSI